MNKRVFLQTSLGLGATGMLGRAFGTERRAPRRFASDLALEGLVWRDRSMVALGTVLSLRVAHREAVMAEAALDAAVATLRHIESQMSLFQPDSALRRLNRSGRLRQPDPDLLQVLQLAQQVSARSQGSFDVTVQPLWEAFEAAGREGQLPSTQAVSEARAKVDWRQLQLDPRQISLGVPGMAVTLNGIAQGYAADRVRATLREHGIEHALINTGEWAALGRPNAQRSWVLGIANPRIAVAGLNPHCGEGGILGKEDDEIVAPVVRDYADRGFSGPWPGDTVFIKLRARQFDAVVAMFHDQGHIPVKLMGFQVDPATGAWQAISGVNITLGLPILRTSVDHGTAFDIAGKGVASADSLVEAAEYAFKLIKGQRAVKAAAEVTP